MPNLHPPLSAFPFAFLLVLLVLESINFFKPSSILEAAIKVNIVVAALGVAAAFFSGYHAHDLANQSFLVPDELIDAHHDFGRFLLFLTIAAAPLRFISAKAKYGIKAWRIIAFVLISACTALAIYTGYLGGKLVFEHGAGVKIGNQLF